MHTQSLSDYALVIQTQSVVMSNTHSDILLTLNWVIFVMLSHDLVCISTPEYMPQWCLISGHVPASGIVMTGAGHLPCSHIFHIDANEETDWIAITNNVLVQANSHQITSIAFPALGTGEVFRVTVKWYLCDIQSCS